MEKVEDFMLTTYDNPFNPFDEFENWFKTDLVLGWNCCQTLAREANTSDIVSDEVNQVEIFEAMKRIVKDWPMIYKIVVKTDSGVQDLIEVEKEPI
jgi:hypothetical protein